MLGRASAILNTWWRSQTQHRWHSMRLSQAKKCIPDARESGHEAGRFHSQRIAAEPSVFLDTFKGTGRKAIGFGFPS